MNKKPKLVILKGISGSGKSTWAREEVRNSQGKIKRVNKDDLRAMIDDGQWSQKNEKLIRSIRNNIILNTLDAGKSVIVDDTNLHFSNEREIRKLVANYNVEIEVKFFDTTIEECIARDMLRGINGGVSVGEEVIRGQVANWNKWQHEDCSVFQPDFTPVEFDDKLPKAIQSDLDGTLAIMGDRSPYDGTTVDRDLLDQSVANILINYHQLDYKIILMSGREDDCRELTEFWLQQHKIPYDELHMRKTGDQRKDSIIKYELFDKNIRNKYNIHFVLEDRDQVVKLWREIGLKCFQVEYGNF